MGIRLSDEDETIHPVGAALNWNESRYVDFLDLDQQIGGWLRIGNRPNEGRGEMSACLNLADGTTAFVFSRPPWPSARTPTSPALPSTSQTGWRVWSSTVRRRWPGRWRAINPGRR